MKEYDKLIFEISKEGRRGYSIPSCDIDNMDIEDIIPNEFLRKSDINLPEVSELDVVRHFTLISNKNYGLDSGFYPLGSCTMKYNPKINEDIASMEAFTNIHPYQPEETAQGCLQVMYELQEALCEITGMNKFTLQPAAGAHGELAGLMVMKSYHENKGDFKRTKIIVPDSAHGTNPASASMAGFDIVQIKSDKNGFVDIDELKSVLSDEVAGLMMTNPNTLGVFEKDILEIADLVHNSGGLLYYDGANMNAIMGIVRPGDMGFDVIHLNLHKTFAAPHGGGGPGSGPIGVCEKLAPYLPVPIIEKKEEKFILNYDKPLSIGRMKSFYGNFLVALKAYCYILTMGPKGLKYASEIAVLNANYIKEKLKNHYVLFVDDICKHEFVLSGLKENNSSVSTLDIAKRLIDYGYHPPTIYFPLIVPEALMIEPTETENMETLDKFVDAMISIAKEAKESPNLIKEAPHNTTVKRLDEVKAARNPILKYSE